VFNNLVLLVPDLNSTLISLLVPNVANTPV
jgi:hypothetical protein